MKLLNRVKVNHIYFYLSPSKLVFFAYIGETERSSWFINWFFLGYFYQL